MRGELTVPHDPRAAVIFASVPALEDEIRDTTLLRGLHDLHVATMYVPLLTEDEIACDARAIHLSHDAELLAQRFIEVAERVKRDRLLNDLPLGTIGSSGSAAGAIVAAATRPDLCDAIVSIDGRTDLAVDHLRNVRAPVLLIVKDMPVLRMNREALAQIRGERRMEIVHGSIDCVVEKAVHWLDGNLASKPRRMAAVPVC